MAKPINERNEVCYYDRKPVRKVCHMCPKYILVRGNDPQTGKELDDWNCSDAWIPTLLLEIASAVRKTDAEVSALRNDVQQNNPLAAIIESARNIKLIGNN